MTAKIRSEKATRTAKFWIGFGASAGGLEALRGVARSLPIDADATYIVAQHMAPHHKSLLAEIIGRETEITVADVSDKLVPQRNTIYITPPNQNLLVEGDCLRLVDPSKEPGAPKPSVDTFFTSLAKAKGSISIGIVLSGTGSDGAKGVKAIHDAGGVVVVQDELTAKYTGMPVSALQTGFVDLVMSPEEIGAQIPKIISLPRDLDALRASPLSIDGMSELYQLLMDETKVNFRHYKTATFQRRVERRMAAQNTQSLEEYVELARNSRLEVKALFDDLLISVTSFFRDAAEFDALKKYIAKIVEQKPKDHIRVWIPGTATGEEAYSLAILFSEALLEGGASDNSKLQIFATDIDSNAIEIARKGYYSHSSVEQVPEHLLVKYFDVSVAGYTVKKMLREKMVFSIHNIAQDPPFLNMDMISCRNLLIYFQANLQAEVFSRFHYSLVPHGLLFLGRSEAIAASEALFRQAGHEKHIFFQKPSHERRAPRDIVYERPPPVKVDNGTQRKAIKAAELDLESTLESLLEKLGKCAILIDPEMNLVKGYGNLSAYTELAAGPISTKATSLLKAPYRQDIQAIVPSVFRGNAVGRGYERASANDERYRERLTVYPFQDGRRKELMALAVFEEWIDESGLEVNPSSGDDNKGMEQQIRNLSHELAIAKLNLQQTVEELETSNEELQALNEELQSSNEELQSTNEELETSNEELQSTNEELSTVNEELHVNAGQLTSVNQNLSSILDNVSVPLIVVDKSLNVTNASSSAETFFRFSPDIKMMHASRCRQPAGFPNLVDALNEALRKGEPRNWQISHGEYSATMKIVPHYSHSNELLGAIVIVNDNTTELKQALYEHQLIFENVPAALMVRDSEGVIIQANSATSRLLGRPDRDLAGSRFYDYFDKNLAKKIRAGDQKVLKSGKPLIGNVQNIQNVNGKEAWVRVSLFPAAHPQSDKPVIYSVKEDITTQHHATQALELSELRLDQAVKASKVGLWDWDMKAGTVFWSDALIKMIGANPDALKRDMRDLNSRIHKDDYKMVSEARQRHLEDREPYEVVYRMRTQRRGYIWVQANGQAIWDKQGKPTRLTGTLSDVTEQRENHENLREQKEQLELAATLSGVGHWKVDLLREQVYWSEQVHAIHKTDKNRYEPSLEDGIRFYHPDDREMVQDLVNAAIQNGEGFEFEARIVRTDDVVRTVRSIGTTDLDKTGAAASLFGVFQDITEEKIKEENLTKTMDELARSNEELNRFSYVCSHDMKEPVRMIESLSALLLDPAFQAKKDKTEQLLKRISTNTSRLRAIIDSLLAYSRIDAKVNSEPVDLNVTLKDIVEGLALVIEEEGAKVECGNMPTVIGAPVHYTQLLHNLIANALKFTDKTKPVIRVSSETEEAEWVLLVEDNGPGIPVESRQEIFNIFSRLQRRDEVEGTGLGLSIAQRIVLQYGGTLKCCDSSLGGAGFEIRIPFEGGGD